MAWIADCSGLESEEVRFVSVFQMVSVLWCL